MIQREFEVGERAYRVCEGRRGETVLDSHMGVVIAAVCPTCGWLVEEHRGWFKDTSERWPEGCHSKADHAASPYRGGPGDCPTCGWRSWHIESWDLQTWVDRGAPKWDQPCFEFSDANQFALERDCNVCGWPNSVHWRSYRPEQACDFCHPASYDDRECDMCGYTVEGHAACLRQMDLKRGEEHRICPFCDHEMAEHAKVAFRPPLRARMARLLRRT